MAELNQRMSNLGMNDSVHADGVPSSGASNNSSGSGGRGAYIPPHLRGTRSYAGPASAIPPPVQNGTANGVQSSKWSNGYVINISVSFRLSCFFFVLLFSFQCDIIYFCLLYDPYFHPIVSGSPSFKFDVEGLC